MLGDPALKLKQAKDVRWLSHQAAIDALRRSLLSVLTSLDREAAERGEPAANGLLTFMRKYFFIAALALFADVLPLVCKLSRTLQSSTLDCSILQPVIDSCINNIKKQINTPGYYFSEVDNVIENNHPINVTSSMKSQFETQVRKP